MVQHAKHYTHEGGTTSNIETDVTIFSFLKPRSVICRNKLVFLTVSQNCEKQLLVASLSVRPPARNDSSSNGWIFKKIYI